MWPFLSKCTSTVTFLAFLWMVFWVETGRSSISGSRRGKEAPSDSSGAPGQVQHGAGAREACKNRIPRGAAALTWRARPRSCPGQQKDRGQPVWVEGQEPAWLGEGGRPWRLEWDHLASCPCLWHWKPFCAFAPVLRISSLGREVSMAFCLMEGIMAT